MTRRIGPGRRSSATWRRNAALLSFPRLMIRPSSQGRALRLSNFSRKPVLLDFLLVPCGGGGLLSGSAIAADQVAPGCRVIGVEPEAGDDATRSFRTGTLQTVRNPETIADGARTSSLGQYTFPLIRKHVDDMLTVSDEDLIRTMRFVWTRLKLVVEPTGVLGIGSALQRPDDLPGQSGLVSF